MQAHLNRVNAMRLLGLGLIVVSAVMAGMFGTAAYQLSGVTAGFTDQLQEAVTIALPIAGGVVALFVGWRVFKRLSHG